MLTNLAKLYVHRTRLSTNHEQRSSHQRLSMPNKRRHNPVFELSKQRKKHLQRPTTTMNEPAQSSSSEAKLQKPPRFSKKTECNRKLSASEDNFYDAICRPATRIITSIHANTQIGIARQAKITYAHTIKTLHKMRTASLITINKKGRTCTIKLTKKGLTLLQKIREIQTLLQ